VFGGMKSFSSDKGSVLGVIMGSRFGSEVVRDDFGGLFKSVVKVFVE
jgi:hypothetical protein